MSKLGYVATLVGGMVIGAGALVGGMRFGGTFGEYLTESVTGRETVPQIDESDRPIRYEGLERFSGVDMGDLSLENVCGTTCQLNGTDRSAILMDTQTSEPYAFVRDENDRLYVVPLALEGRADPQ